MSLPNERPNTTYLATLLNRAISLTKSLFESDTSGSRRLSRAPGAPKRKHSSAGDKPLPLHHVSLCRRLGWYSTFILLAGSFVLLSAVGFLAFLWWSDRTNELWRWIVLEDKSSTATVITAVFIQLTVSAQAAVAVSMLASLTLESCGVLLGQSLPLSLARYSNTGPVASLAMFSRNVRKWKGMAAFALTIGLAITTGSSQFASTLLISDVSMGTIEDYPTFLNLSTRPMSITSDFTDTTDYSRLAPTEFQTFAEDSDPVDTPEDQVDTGQVYRAFLPFSDKASRQNILDYSGTATVYDARVACVRPKLSNFTIYYDRPGFVRIGGKIAPNSHVPGASWPTDESSSDSWVEVSCQTEGDFGWGYGYSYVFCRLSEGVRMNTGIRRNHWWMNGQGQGWFLFSWRGILQSADMHFVQGKNEEGWVDTEVYLPAYSSPSTSSWNSTEAGPWLTISPTRINPWQASWATGMKEPSITINATICYDSFARSANIDIFATSSSNRTEPSSRFMTPKNMTILGSHSTESASPFYDMEEVKKQAGATLSRYSHAERGILSLDRQRLRQSLSRWKEKEIEYSEDPILIQPPMNGTMAQIIQIYWASPSSHAGAVMSGDFKTISYKHGALFLSTVEETRDPSLAIQALYLSLARIPYYLFLPDYDYREPALTKSTVLRSYPRINRGISAVLSIIGVHLALVLFITVLFCLRTSYSLLDQAWPAVAQVFTSNTEEILRVSTLSKDRDVEKMVRKSGDKFDGCVHLQEERGSGRVGMVF